MTEEIKQLLQKASEELTATLQANAATEEERKTLDVIGKAAAHIRQQLHDGAPNTRTRIKMSDLRTARKMMQRYVQKTSVGTNIPREYIGEAFYVQRQPVIEFIQDYVSTETLEALSEITQARLNAFTGAPSTVGEGGSKPSMSTTPNRVTTSFTKIAFTDLITEEVLLAYPNPNIVDFLIWHGAYRLEVMLHNALITAISAVASAPTLPTGLGTPQVVDLLIFMRAYHDQLAAINQRGAWEANIAILPFPYYWRVRYGAIKTTTGEYVQLDRQIDGLTLIPYNQNQTDPTIVFNGNELQVFFLGDITVNLNQVVDASGDSNQRRLTMDLFYAPLTHAGFPKIVANTQTAISGMV
jgi:hypothetical protein